MSTPEFLHHPLLHWINFQMKSTREEDSADNEDSARSSASKEILAGMAVLGANDLLTGKGIVNRNHICRL